MHDCTKRGLHGALMANAAVDQGPLFKAQNINNAGFESMMGFAKAFSRMEDNNVSINQVVFHKDVKLKAIPHVWSLVNKFRTTEAVIPKKIYAKIDKRMTQWASDYKKTTFPKLIAIEKKYEALIEKTKDPGKIEKLELAKERELAPIRREASDDYKERISEQFKEANQQIQDVFNDNRGNTPKLEAALKRMGMTKMDAYHVHNYLNWLQNGGPFFEPFNPGIGNKTGGDETHHIISTITRNKVSFDPRQILYNTAEFAQKGPSVAGFRNTIGGIIDAYRATKKQGVHITDRIPSLEKEGVYANDFSPLRPTNKNDTTLKTQNMLDNFSYYTGKRMGNVQKAMTGIAYRPKPWNDIFGFQDPRFRDNFHFMSFQLRHIQQYGGWAKAAGKGSTSAMKSLAVYSLMTSIIYGDRAAIPAPFYWMVQQMYPELDEDIKKAQSKLPGGTFLNTGLVGLTGKAVTGGKIDVDVTKYARPLGGPAIGIGQDLAQLAFETGPRTVKRASKQIKEGEYGKAAALVASGIAVISQTQTKGANAFMEKTITGLTNAYLDDELNPVGITEKLGQKYLGRDSVKIHKENQKREKRKHRKLRKQREKV